MSSFVCPCCHHFFLQVIDTFSPSLVISFKCSFFLNLLLPMFIVLMRHFADNPSFLPFSKWTPSRCICCFFFHSFLSSILQMNVVKMYLLFFFPFFFFEWTSSRHSLFFPFFSSLYERCQSVLYCSFQNLCLLTLVWIELSLGC